MPVANMPSDAICSIRLVRFNGERNASLMRPSASQLMIRPTTIGSEPQLAISKRQRQPWLGCGSDSASCAGEFGDIGCFRRFREAWIDRAWFRDICRQLSHNVPKLILASDHPEVIRVFNC